MPGKVHKDINLKPSIPFTDNIKECWCIILLRLILCNDKVGDSRLGIVAYSLQATINGDLFSRRLFLFLDLALRYQQDLELN